METATYLIFVIGVMGALDIAFFHSLSHGIRSHPDSFAELITHSLRGPTYAALFVLIPNFQMHGLFAWGLIFLFVFDIGISICDFWLEQESRCFFGGLPSGEYVLHILISMVFGAFVMSCIGSLLRWAHFSTEFVYSPADVPWALRLILLIMSGLVLISGAQDGLAAWRLRSQDARSHGPE
jgi:phosphatidylglycerophosphate synthase